MQQSNVPALHGHYTHTHKYILTSTRISAFLESSGGLIVPDNLRNRLPCILLLLVVVCEDDLREKRGAQQPMPV